MPLLTPQLMHEIAEIIRKHHTALVANLYGHDAVPTAVLEDLKSIGLVDKNANSVEDAYLYGQVMALLEDPAVMTWSDEKVKDFAKKNPIPLTAQEQAAVKTAKLTAATYVVGLGNAIEKETKQLLIEADHKLRDELKEQIADEAAKNLVARDTVKELKSALGHATKDWTRNFDRIAITEKHNAATMGTLSTFQKKFGDDVHISYVPAPDACADCKRLHLGPDGKPRIFKLSQLAPPGANVKKPKAQWVASRGAVHPHCGCVPVRVPAGWGFDEDGTLVHGGKYGVAYEDESEKSLLSRFEREWAHRDVLEKAMHRLVGRIEFDGLLIAIEQEKGDERFWKDRNGETGSTTMLYPYGFIEGTKGADGEAIDVYVGPNPEAENVYVVDQRKKLGDGKFGGFDEQKVMLGFSSLDEARAAYLAHYDDPGFLGSIRAMPFDEFKAKLANDEKKQILKSAQPVVDAQFVVAVDGIGFETLYPDTVLEKAGPYIGPKGGKYADPAHTTPWHPQKLTDLPVDEEETWDDGTKVTFRRTPFPKGSKPNVPGRLHDTATVEHVDLDSLRSSQGRVTENGVQQYAGKQLDEHAHDKTDLPLVYRMKDGTHVIGDGHHRLVAARLRGEKTAPVRVVHVPDEMQKALVGHKYLTKVFSHGHWVYTYADEHGGKVVDHATDPEQAAIKLPKAKAGELEAFRQKHGLPGQVIVGSQYAILGVHKDAFTPKAATKDGSSISLTVPATSSSGKLWEGKKKLGALQLAELPVGTRVKGYYGDKGFTYRKVDGGWVPAGSPGDKPMGSGDFAKLVPDGFEHFPVDDAPAKKEEPKTDEKPKHVTHTPEFKSWFGDWTKDPASASKVVDEHGNPQEEYGEKPVVMYHGTPVGGFQNFDPKKDKGANIFGKGFYFTADKSIATEYTKKDADTALASATGIVDDEGKPITHLTKKQAEKLLAMVGGEFKNPNWDYNIEWGVKQATDAKGKVEVAKLLSEFWNPTHPDAGKGFKAPIKDVSAQGGVKLMSRLLKVTGGKPVVPESQVFEVYLSVKKPVDMDKPAPFDEVRKFASFLAHHNALTPESHVEATDYLAQRYFRGEEVKNLPTNFKTSMPVTPEEAEQAKQRAAKAHADYANGVAPSKTPQVYLNEVTDSQEGALDKLGIGPNSHTLDVTPENLLKLKQSLVERTKGQKYNGRQVLGLLHISDKNTLTWGDVHYLLTDAHSSYSDTKSLFTQWAKREGYDGIHHTGGWNIGTHAHSVWIAFDPKQIKATTSEKFDPTTDNIYKAMLLRSMRESEVTESDHGEVNGGGAMLVADAPPQPVHFPDIANTRLVLTDAQDMQPETRIVRPKETYERPDERFSYVLPIEQGQPAAERLALASIDVTQQRADVNRVAEFDRGAAPTPVVLPGQAIEKAKRVRCGPTPDDLIKAFDGGGHKYTKKTWHAGHWIYEYAEKVGGKVSPHNTDPSQIAVKVPKGSSGVLNHLKAKYGITGSVIEGSHYAILPVKEGELPAQKDGAVKPATQDAAPPLSSHAKALDVVVKATGMTHAALKSALTSTSLDVATKTARANIVAAIMKSDAHVHDAIREVLKHHDVVQGDKHIDNVTTGSAKGIARAKSEFKAVPLFDLAALTKLEMFDKPINGYACAYMATGAMKVGVRPNTGDYATGDFRHELGHLLHGTFMHVPALNKTITSEYEKAIAKKNAKPHGPDNADWFEENWGVPGPRAVDNEKEFIAEHYRGYHRALFQEQQQGKPKGSKSLDEYRQRHPEMAKFFDAHYTAALLGELAKKGAW